MDDIDRDGYLEIVATTSNKTYIWKYDGTNVNGWPKDIGSLYPPVLGDINGDGYSEILLSSGNMIYAWKHDGANVNGWPGNVNDSLGWGVDDSLGCIAIADINKNNYLEVVAGSDNGVYAWNHNGTGMDGFPIVLNDSAQYPVLGDINQDGYYEIITPVMNKTYVWNYTGGCVNGWPVELNDPMYAPLASLGDMNGDGYLDIVMHTEIPVRDTHKIYSLNHNGSLLDGWPIPVDYAAPSPFSIGDIDDGYMDLLMGINSVTYRFNEYPFYLILTGELNVWHHLNPSGNNSDEIEIKWARMAGEDGGGWMHLPPELVDLDKDSDLEIVLTSVSYIQIWDEPTAYNPLNIEWASFRHDARRTGAYMKHAPDLTISSSDIKFSNTNPDPGENVTINVTIYNLGDVIASNISVKFFEDYPNATNGTLLENYTIESLDFGCNKLLNLSWIAKNGSYRIYVVIDSYDLIDENNENNNLIYSEIVVDKIPPVITLVSPADNANSTTHTTTFSYNVTDSISGIANCSLFINETAVNTDMSVTMGTSQSFGIHLDDGIYSWRIDCTDTSPNVNTGSSETWLVNVSVTEYLVNLTLKSGWNLISIPLDAGL